MHFFYLAVLCEFYNDQKTNLIKTFIMAGWGIEVK